MREQSAPPRVIGLAGAVLINLNGVVGAGIFALPALLYAGAGGLAPLVVLAYALVMVPPLLVVAGALLLRAVKKRRAASSSAAAGSGSGSRVPTTYFTIVSPAIRLPRFLVP